MAPTTACSNESDILIGHQQFVKWSPFPVCMVENISLSRDWSRRQGLACKALLMNYAW